MKKTITISTATIVTIIIILGIIGLSDMESERPNEIYIVEREEPDGEIVCPNGVKIVPADFVSSLRFSEEESGVKGRFSATSLTANSPELIATFSKGNLESGNYSFKGEGFFNSNLSILCSLDTTNAWEITVWGKCGIEVLIKFDTDIGISGTAMGTAYCI